MKELREPVA